MVLVKIKIQATLVIICLVVSRELPLDFKLRRLASFGVQ
jgi:hypothetical protein